MFLFLFYISDMSSISCWPSWSLSKGKWDAKA